MKRRRKEINHKTSPSPTQRLRCREISTGEKSDDNISIPLDLTVEILKKLPAKSLMRFRCVSKHWSSIIDSRRDFIDSIVTRSLIRPSPRDTYLIFCQHTNNSQESRSFIFSSTYPKNLEKESVSTPGSLFSYVRGLILCWRQDPCAAAIYNPTTRQSLSLPEMELMQFGTYLFGYDLVENQYKVLCIRYYMKQFGQVFTLGDPTKKWRNIQCNVEHHLPAVHSVCINGTIYYQARSTNKHFSFTYALMSFDVRSEEFDQVEDPKTPMDSRFTLINYRGKLGYIKCCEKGLEIWVIKYAEKKQEWSKIIFYEMEGFEYWQIKGVTGGGEIVFINYMEPRYQKFDVFYYDPKRNSLRRGSMVKSTRISHNSHIEAVPDHVENTMRL